MSLTQGQENFLRTELGVKKLAVQGCIRSGYTHMREQIRRDHAFLDLGGDFLINEVKVYVFEPEMVSMNCKFSVLSIATTCDA